ncbi:MAG: 30S ribosomal protein S6--L-glutamate ligase [Thermoleophilia bacterium]|nr:30S ribosomal protein S6--L-glutamate ligase [Thermoleophilia bacterium]
MVTPQAEQASPRQLNLLVLSRGKRLYSTRRLVEAAVARGHSCRVIDHTRCYVEVSNTGPRVFFDGEPLVDVDAIIPRIGASVTEYGSSIVRQFETQGVFTVTPSIALVRARDKLRSLQLLAREKAAIPHTLFARRASDLDDLLERLGGPPVVIKLLEGTQGVGVVLAETKKAAKSVLQAFEGLKADVIVQEFIKEAKGADLRVIVVGGRVVAAMRRVGAPGEFRANVHQGGTTEKVKLTQRERRLAVKAAKALGLPVAGVDLLRSERGPLVIEVNASPGLEGIEFASEVDVAGAIVQWIEENLPKKRKRDRVGA